MIKVYTVYVELITIVSLAVLAIKPYKFGTGKLTRKSIVIQPRVSVDNSCPLVLGSLLLRRIFWLPLIG